MLSEEEIWVKIRGHDLYSISNNGDVKSFKGRNVSKKQFSDGKISHGGRDLLRLVGKSGRIYYNLDNRQYPADGLVCDNFIGKIEPYARIVCKDGDFNNLSISNLAYKSMEKIEGEVWKSISFADKYEVSNYGRVRVLPKNNLGDFNNGRLVGTFDHKYPVCRLNKNGIKRKIYIHDLVALEFIGPKPKGMYVCHSDDDSKNNHVSNLRYATPKENCQDKVDNGNHQNGEANYSAELSGENVFHIRLLCDEEILSQREIAEIYGVSQSNISAIKLNKSWTHI